METKYRHRYLLERISEYIKNNNIEGNCFVESGVKYGSASIAIAKELERKGYLFDTWCNFPHFSDYDARSLKRRIKLKKRVKGGRDTYQECSENLSKNNVENLCKMIKGDICKTIPKFVKDNKEKLSISLIHSDSDLYKPTKITLNKLWPFLVDGGMVLVHDYKTKQWPGVEKSVDEFLSDKTNILTAEFDKNVTICFLIMKDNNNKYKSDFNMIVKHVNDKFPFKK
jgi:hypothetical protein